MSFDNLARRRQTIRSPSGSKNNENHHSLQKKKAGRCLPLLRMPAYVKAAKKATLAWYDTYMPGGSVPVSGSNVILQRETARHSRPTTYRSNQRTTAINTKTLVETRVNLTCPHKLSVSSAPSPHQTSTVSAADKRLIGTITGFTGVFFFNLATTAVHAKQRQPTTSLRLRPRQLGLRDRSDGLSAATGRRNDHTQRTTTNIVNKTPLFALLTSPKLHNFRCLKCGQYRGEQELLLKRH